jgi:hypothetical protein
LKRPTKKKRSKAFGSVRLCLLLCYSSSQQIDGRRNARWAKGRNAAHLCAPFIYFLRLVVEDPEKSRGSENVSLIFSFLLFSSSSDPELKTVLTD